MPKTLRKFQSGHEKFRETIYGPNKETFDDLLRAQFPKSLIIACCDSRVDPVTITQADPGDVFTVRNVANLVPPFDADRLHGTCETSAALEYALFALEVDHIIVLGHWGCGGIEALMKEDPDIARSFPHLTGWMNLARPVRAKAQAKARREEPEADLATQCRCGELESIRWSLNNLETYPWVKDRLAQGRVKLHGWYFHLPSGTLTALDQKTDTFLPLDQVLADQVVT